MPSFRVLSIDGGGIRGVFAAAFLAGLEEEIAEPIGGYFDLMAGTSTGGIIALALAAGRSAAEIHALYVDNAEEIFDPQLNPWWTRKAARIVGLRLPAVRRFENDVGLFRSKYQPAMLREVLQGEFGSLTVGDLKRRVVVPAVDLTTASNVVFKTPHLPDLTRDRAFSVADVAIATSAAPTYFPHASIQVGSAYADGGLWANNPAIVAYAEAIRIRELCRREVDPAFGIDEIEMLSVGTGRLTHYGRPGSDDTGLLWWAPRLIDVVGLSQSRGYHNLAEYLMRDRYARIDFELPSAEWKLDNIQKVNELTHYGREEATRRLPELKHRFLSEPVPDFAPFANS